MFIRIFLILYIASLSPVFAQLSKQDQERTATSWSDIFFRSSETVIPLLMEAAIQNSAALNKLEASEKIAHEELMLSKKSLMSGLGIGASYHYGTMLNFLGTEQLNSSLNAFALPAQAQYQTGISFNYPLSKLFGHPHELRKQKQVQQQWLASKDMEEKEIRKAVIMQYQEVLLAKTQMDLYQKLLSAAQTSLELSEKEFTNGQILFEEHSKHAGEYATTSAAFQAAKINYETTILLMEELIGMRIADLMNASK